MGVNCSESGLKAMSKVVKNDGLAVIHTVNGMWKVKHFPIAVVHARQRPLSLLERFVLKALIQVQGCTIEDLVSQFGLQRGLVDSTLRVIKNCNLIDLEVVGDESDEQRTRRSILEAELKTVLDTLAHSSGTGTGIGCVHLCPEPGNVWAAHTLCEVGDKNGNDTLLQLI